MVVWKYYLLFKSILTCSLYTVFYYLLPSKMFLYTLVFLFLSYICALKIFQADCYIMLIDFHFAIQWLIWKLFKKYPQSKKIIAMKLWWWSIICHYNQVYVWNTLEQRESCEYIPKKKVGMLLEPREDDVKFIVQLCRKMLIYSFS